MYIYIYQYIWRKFLSMLVVNVVSTSHDLFSLTSFSCGTSSSSESCRFRRRFKATKKTPWNWPTNWPHKLQLFGFQTYGTIPYHSQKPAMYIKMIIYVPCIFMYIYYLMVNIQGAFFAWTRFSKIAPMALKSTGVTGQKTPQWVGSFSVPAAVIKSILLKHNSNQH